MGWASSRSACLRSGVAAGILELAMVGCAPESVSIDLPPRPPPKGSVGACGDAPVPLVHLPAIALHALGIDELNLYVVAASGGDASAAQSVWRVPKDGSSPQRLVTTEAPIAAVAFDAGGFAEATEIFWTTSGADGGATGSVGSLRLGPSDAPVILASHRRAPGAIVVVGPRVYWSEQDIDPSGQPVEAIVSTSTTGGAVTTVQTLGTDQIPRTLAAYQGISASNAFVGWLYWTTWDSRVGSEGAAEVVSCPVPTPFGPLTAIAGPDAGGVAAMQLGYATSAVLYSGPLGIMEVAVKLDGGLDAPRLIADAGGFVDRIEDDVTAVYFVERATGSLVATPRFAADAAVARSPRTLATSVDPAAAFQVDDACVYWIDPHAEAIMMATKHPP